MGMPLLKFNKDDMKPLTETAVLVIYSFRTARSRPRITGRFFYSGMYEIIASPVKDEVQEIEMLGNYRLLKVS